MNVDNDYYTTIVVNVNVNIQLCKYCIILEKTYKTVSYTVSVCEKHTQIAVKSSYVTM